MVEQLVDSLVAMGFLEEHLGYGGSLVGVKRSRFEILPIFETQLRNCGVEDNAIFHTPPERLIVLKDKDKRLVEASEEDAAIREALERQVRQINTRISKSFVDLILTTDELTTLRGALRKRKEKSFSNHRNARRFDLSNKYLYRVFNRSSFERGGRFYGGWWGALPKEWRGFITIDNWFTEEIDYSAMHINLLYNQIGIDPKNLFQDPYALEGLDLTYRNTTKQIMLILLNATTLKKSLKAVNAKAKEEGSELSLPKEMKSYSDYIALIERCHEPIKQFIGKDVGVSLQNKDSKIAMNIMLRMDNEHQATCLPIHDSFIVADPHADALKEIMLQEYKAFTGFECRVATKSETRGKVDNEQRRQIIDAMYEDEEEQRLGYPARLAAWAKENDGEDEVQSGDPITEKPRRLSAAN